MANIETYEGYPIAFEKKDGKMMVNATQMGKAFGKQPRDWLKCEQATRIISCVSAKRNILPSDLVMVINEYCVVQSVDFNDRCRVHLALCSKYGEC